MNVSLRIMTPGYGGFTGRYIDSLLRLRRLCGEANIPFHWSAVEGVADIVSARNEIARSFMTESDASHVLMIDSDIGYDPQIVMRMLKRDVPFACAAPPARSLRLDLFQRAATGGDRNAQRFIPKFYVQATDEDRTAAKFNVDDQGFAKIESIGGAFMLIHRDVFTKLAEVGDVEKFTQAEKPFIGYFDHKTIPAGRLAEDLAFCWRWRQVGGDIHLLVNSPMTHTGPYTFTGDFAAFIGAEEVENAMQTTK